MQAYRGVLLILALLVVICFKMYVVHVTTLPENEKSAGKPINISSVPFKANASNWTIPTLPKRLQNADQEDMDLIRHIKKHWIIPPPANTGNIDMANAGWYRDFSEQGQPMLIDKLLNRKRNGFILECGAADGFISSNSLYFEALRNWTGLLIEGNPNYFKSLLQRRRGMYIMNVCLSPGRTPMVANFALNQLGGGIAELIPPGQKVHWKSLQVKKIKVQCFPLYSILAALEVSHVDYFSLDVEGAEVPILRNLPLDRIEVDAFTIEKRVKDDAEKTKKKEETLENILSGYRLVTKLALDMVFIKKHESLN